MTVAVVWIDREGAQLYFLSGDKVERSEIRPGLFQQVGKALEGADQILILGPGIAKHHFRSYMMEQKPMVAKKIVRVETVDHPSDGQIIEIAKEFYEMVSA